MIVTAHQPGYLPGVSVIAKIAAADAVVWLDDVRFTMPGWTNRNQLPDGYWLTVPVERSDHRTPIREVTIAANPYAAAQRDWREQHVAALRARYTKAAHYDPRLVDVLTGALALPGAPLVELNLRLLDLILSDLGLPATSCQHRQSVVDAPVDGSLSTRLAKMVRAVGGTTYLNGPSPSLDSDAFAAEGIELATFRFAGRNPSVVDPLFRVGHLPSEPSQEVAAV